MADDLTTVLRFVGDIGNADAAIESLIASLKRAAAQTGALFAQSLKGGNQSADALDKAAAAADRAARASRQGADNSLALAQASARLQVAQGNAAGAANTLQAALAGVDRNSVAAIRAQTQLVSIQAQVATAAGKAETAMLNEARAVARLQQISGDAPAAIKTLGVALEKATNKSSLPALRAELQKTYLDTNYANSPLIGAINRVNEGFTRFLPLLGPVGTGMQRVIGFASAVGNAFKDTEKQSSGAIQSISQGVTGLAQTAASVAQSTVSVGQTVATGLSQASEAVKAVTSTAKDVGKNLFTGSTESAAAFLARAKAANEAIVANSKAESRAAEISKQLGQAENARQQAIAQTILANQRIREKAIGEIAREEKAVRSLITAERERQAQAGKAETDLIRQGQAAQQATGAFGIFARAKQLALSFFRDQGGEASATDFFLNLSKLASQAGDRMRSAIAGAVTSIRQSLAGLGERSPFTTLFSGADKAAADVGVITKALPALTAESGAAARGLTAVGGASTGMAIAIGAALVAVAALVAAIAGIVTVSAAAASGLRSIGEAGIAVNTQLETLRVGLTTVIASVAEIRNSEGIQLKGIDAINAALPVASDQLRKLRIDALETSATVADIAPAFQAAIGPGLVAGLTIDQIRENTIKLTQAVTALGLPLDQIKQETRAILSGDINRNTQAAIALGITREQVKEAQKSGTFAAFLEEKLSAAAAAGKLVSQTFAAAQSNLREAGDTFQAVVTEGLFNQLRDKANQILPQIFDKNSATLISKNFEGISETLTRVFDTAGATINRVIDFIFNGLKSISSFLDQNQETVGTIIESVNQIVILVGETIKGVAEVVFGAAGGKAEFESMADVLKLVAFTVGLISDGIKIVTSAAFTLGGVIRVAILAPLELAVTIMARLLSFVPGAGAALESFSQGLTNARRAATAGVADSAKTLITAIADTGKASDKAIKSINDAAKRAKAGQRAIPGVESKTPGATGATIRPPRRPGEDEKGAGSKARQQAAAELKLLQNLEKQSELANKRIAEGLRASLQDRLISLQTFTELSIENDRDLLEKRLASLKAEEEAAIRTAKNATEAEAKRAEFKLKRDTLQQDADIKAEQLRDELRRTAERAEEDHQNRLLAIRDVARKAVEASIRASVTSGLIGFEEGERRLIEQERTRFAEREGLLNANLEATREDAIKRQEIQDQLEQLAIERIAFEEEASRRINDAQRKEAEGFLDLLRKRVNALSDLRKAQIDAQAAQAVLATQRGLLTRPQAEQAEFQRRRDLLKIEQAEREAAIEREAEDLKRQAANQAGAANAIVDIERSKNERLRAERERAAAEDAALENQQRAVSLAPIFGEEAAERIAATEQVLGGAVGVLDQLRIAAQTTADSLLVSMPTIGQVFDQAALAIADSTASIIASFLSGQVPIRKAAAALYAAALKPLKDFLLKKATAEFALALADLAIGNYGGAAKHTLAGVGLSAAAALIDVGGAAIAGGGSGGAAGAAISGGGRQDTESQQRGPISQQTPRPEQTVIVIRPEINLRGDITKGVLSVVHDDIANNGQTRRLIQETGATG